MTKNPFKELAATLDNHMQKRASEATNEAWLGAELGTMTGDMGLQLDSLKNVVYDYMLAHYLTLAEPDFTNTEVVGGGGGYAEFAPHSHPVITPEQLLPLHPGDRVLVMPVNSGQDFVIVARVVPKG